MTNPFYAVTVLRAHPAGLMAYAVVLAFPGRVMVLGRAGVEGGPATEAERLEFQARVSAAQALAYPESRVLS